MDILHQTGEPLGFDRSAIAQRVADPADFRGDRVGAFLHVFVRAHGFSSAGVAAPFSASRRASTSATAAMASTGMSASISSADRVSARSEEHTSELQSLM